MSPSASDREGKPPRLPILGRTGSLFTRVALIFAEEAGIDYDLVIMNNLISDDPAAWWGNPSLRIPAVRLPEGELFGSRSICRALAARATRPLRVAWPEHLTDISVINAHDIVAQGMAAQVQLLMAADFGQLVPDDRFFAKVRAGLQGSLQWLDGHLPALISSLPGDRDLSLLEVELFCLLEHLVFGPTVAIDRCSSLRRFARDFGTRASARRTVFRR